jgi:hypothetical protein
MMEKGRKCCPNVECLRDLPHEIVAYIECRTTKERNGIVWLLAGLWKLRGSTNTMGKESCKEDIKHIILSCPETRI